MKLIRYCTFFAAILLALASACNKKPTADFSYSPENPSKGDTVTFTNLSEDAAKFNWDFGDGYYTLEENPTHVFEYSGSFFVRLVVQNGARQDYAEKPIKVD